MFQITTFDQLASEIAEPDRVIPILQRHFKSVEDVDLFILGLAEKPVKGSLVGPTFGCVLSLQFQKVPDENALLLNESTVYRRNVETATGTRTPSDLGRSRKSS